MLDLHPMDEILSKFNEILKKANSIAVVGHIQPDSDCISSTLVMQKYLKSLYPEKSIKIVIESRPINEWPFGDLNDQIVWTDNAVTATKNCDLVVFVDGNTATRFTSTRENFLNRYTACFDHHSNPADSYDVSVIDVNATSAIEVLLTLFWKKSNSRAWLDEYYANISLYGILSDTGTFRFVDHLKAQIFLLVNALLTEFKLSITSIDNYLNSYKSEQLEFLGVLLQRTQYLKDEGIEQFMYTYVEVEDNKKYSQEVTKAAVNSYKYMFLKQVEGYKWGFVISQTNKNDVDISFRSQPDGYDVNRISLQLNGGGHPRAAAAHIPATSVKSRGDVVELIVQKVKEIYHAD